MRYTIRLTPHLCDLPNYCERELQKLVDVKIMLKVNDCASGVCCYW